MTKNAFVDVYEITFIFKVTWQAHSLSNAGTNGSIRTMSRKQLLADGTETDACSGGNPKQHHAALLIEYFWSNGVPVCSACRVHDGRRAFALEEKGRTMQSILKGCGICDCHGFLIPAKKGGKDGQTIQREKISKSTLIEYSMALAIPGASYETTQLYTRTGDEQMIGQMLLKAPARSGEYALCVRYQAVGVGTDTDKWHLIVTDQDERRKRHQAILSAFRDQMLSPDGALTAKLLPHLTGFEGMIMARKTPGRAPLYSALERDYCQRLKNVVIPNCEALQFKNIDEFSKHMSYLAEQTIPMLPPFSESRGRQ